MSNTTKVTFRCLTPAKVGDEFLLLGRTVKVVGCESYVAPFRRFMVKMWRITVENVAIEYKFTPNPA